MYLEKKWLILGRKVILILPRVLMSIDGFVAQEKRYLGLEKEGKGWQGTRNTPTKVNAEQLTWEVLQKQFDFLAF